MKYHFKVEENGEEYWLEELVFSGDTVEVFRVKATTPEDYAEIDFLEVKDRGKAERLAQVIKENCFEDTEVIVVEVE